MTIKKLFPIFVAVMLVAASLACATAPEVPALVTAMPTSVPPTQVSNPSLVAAKPTGAPPTQITYPTLPPQWTSTPIAAEPTQRPQATDTALPNLTPYPTQQQPTVAALATNWTTTSAPATVVDVDAALSQLGFFHEDSKAADFQYCPDVSDPCHHWLDTKEGPVSGLPSMISIENHYNTRILMITVFTNVGLPRSEQDSRLSDVLTRIYSSAVAMGVAADARGMQPGDDKKMGHTGSSPSDLVAWIVDTHTFDSGAEAIVISIGEAH